MEQIGRWIVMAACALWALLMGLLGGWDLTLKTLVLFIGLDILTGFILAVSNKSHCSKAQGACSSVSFRGLTKKGVMLIMVALAVALDGLLEHPNTLRLVVSMFYTANEGLSIIENAALLGLPLPKALKSALKVIKNDNEIKEAEGANKNADPNG